MRLAIVQRFAGSAEFRFVPSSTVEHDTLRLAMPALIEEAGRAAPAGRRLQIRGKRRDSRLSAMKLPFRGGGVGLIFLCLSAVGALASDPVALVEEVEGAPAGVEAMAYLNAGTVIQLGATDGITIDYLASCARDKITGGVVTIGTISSKVVGGHLVRQAVQCDGGQLNLSTAQAAQGGVMVFRGLPSKASKRPEHIPVDRTLYGLCPLVDLHGAGRLVVERLDQPGERTEIDVPTALLVRGSFYDFAKEGRSLAAGGIYRVSSGEHSIVIRIDPRAQPGQAPPAGRLVRL